MARQLKLQLMLWFIRHWYVISYHTCDFVLTYRCADEMSDGKWNKFRDDVDHHGRKIDWGKWAITGNDPAFGGTGNPDTGQETLQHCLSVSQSLVTLIA